METPLQRCLLFNGIDIRWIHGLGRGDVLAAHSGSGRGGCRTSASESRLIQIFLSLLM